MASRAVNSDPDSPIAFGKAKGGCDRVVYHTIRIQTIGVAGVEKQKSRIISGTHQLVLGHCTGTVWMVGRKVGRAKVHSNFLARIPGDTK